MVLLCIDSGMRIGEPCVLHWEDVGEDYIYIHRQQVRDNHVKPEKFYEVEYTKNELRKSTHEGRYFPITPDIRNLLDEVRSNSDPDATYVFEQNGKWITKTSLERFLERHLKKLGFTITSIHQNISVG